MIEIFLYSHGWGYWLLAEAVAAVAFTGVMVRRGRHRTVALAAV